GGGTVLVLRAALVRLPVHAEGAIVEHLKTIHPDVARAGDGIAREHRRERDVPPSVAGPAREDRQPRERRLRRLDDFLARRAAHPPRRGLGDAEQGAELAHLVEERARYLEVEQ